MLPSAADSLLLSVTKSVQKRCMATLFTSRKGHPDPRSRYRLIVALHAARSAS